MGRFWYFVYFSVFLKFLSISSSSSLLPSSLLLTLELLRSNPFTPLSHFLSSSPSFLPSLLTSNCLVLPLLLPSYQPLLPPSQCLEFNLKPFGEDSSSLLTPSIISCSFTSSPSFLSSLIHPSLLSLFYLFLLLYSSSLLLKFQDPFSSFPFFSCFTSFFLPSSFSSSASLPSFQLLSSLSF